MKTLLSQNINWLWSDLIFDQLTKMHIDQVYLSPGMRNAPLIAAIHNAQIKVELAIDERAASYRALGYAKATGRPAVLVCTSGTAMANYLPAIIEAKKAQVPMIILSADRPPELTHSDENQTIDQLHFFGNHVLDFYNIGLANIDHPLQAMLTNVINVSNRSMNPIPGPVHLNIQFKEPLDSSKQTIPPKLIEEALSLIQSTTPVTDYHSPVLRLENGVIKKLATQLNSMPQGILVVGPLRDKEDQNQVIDFIKYSKLPFFIDVGSSLKYEFNLSDGMIPTFDHPEIVDHFNINPPSYILHLGGRITSKHYYSFIKQNPKIELISVNDVFNKEDPTHLTKARYISKISLFLSELTEHFKVEKHFKTPTAWIEMAQKKIDLINQAPFTFPSISKGLIENLSDGSILFVGNSTIIRSFDSYISNNQRKKFDLYSNRGVSGIEGNVSTALGIADACSKPVICVLGDISFMHDLNSVFMWEKCQTQVITIVINNSSGGIFTLLPIQKDQEILPYMTTPHETEFKAISSLSKIDYMRVDHLDGLIRSLNNALNSQKHCLIEAIVNNEENIQIYNQLKTIKT